MTNVARTLTFCLGLSLPQAALAQSPRLSEILDAQMRTGWKTEQGTHMAALHLQLAPDWITYWRHPGETGIVPQFDWSGSRNLAHARVHWPEPRLFIKSGFQSIGYADELVLPIELTPVTPGQPIELDATMLLGVCDDICIPVDLDLNATMHGAGQQDRAIAAALSSRPGTAKAAGLRAVSCEIAPHQRGLQLSAALDMPQNGANEFALVEMTGAQGPGRSLGSERNGDALMGHMLLPGTTTAIDRSAVRVSVVTEQGTVVHQGCALTD